MDQIREAVTPAVCAGRDISACGKIAA